MSWRKKEDISTKGKTIQTKEDIPKQEKNILPTLGGPNDFGKLWPPKEHNSQ